MEASQNAYSAFAFVDKFCTQRPDPSYTNILRSYLPQQVAFFSPLLPEFSAG